MKSKHRLNSKIDESQNMKLKRTHNLQTNGVIFEHKHANILSLKELGVTAF